VYELIWTEKAEADFLRLREEVGGKKSSRQKGLLSQVVKALKFLRNDPRHPGLNTHPYHSLVHPWSKSEKVFEAYAQNRTPGAYRIFWCYGPKKNEITIIAITPHP
jgi:hypothetical protein